jgi:hypothetical protein
MYHRGQLPCQRPEVVTARERARRRQLALIRRLQALRLRPGALGNVPAAAPFAAAVNAYTARLARELEAEIATEFGLHPRAGAGRPGACWRPERPRR